MPLDLLQIHVGDYRPTPRGGPQGRVGRAQRSIMVNRAYGMSSHPKVAGRGCPRASSWNVRFQLPQSACCPGLQFVTPNLHPPFVHTYENGLYDSSIPASTTPSSNSSTVDASLSSQWLFSGVIFVFPDFRTSFSDGLFTSPMDLECSDIRQLPARTKQITHANDTFIDKTIAVSFSWMSFEGHQGAPEANA